MIFLESTKGFLDKEEGNALYKLAKKASKLGPCLEIGSYCGKSAICIGTACKEESTVLFSVDPHRGSQEHQLGEEYFDLKSFDHSISSVNTLNIFLNNIAKAGLNKNVIPIINKSDIVAKIWNMQLGLVFIDGAHDYCNAFKDYINWHKHVVSMGYVIFHDMLKYENEKKNEIYKVYEIAIESGLYLKNKEVKTLGILQRKK